MKRRSFLKNSSLLTLPAMVGGLPIATVSKSSLNNWVNDDSDRVLVLIELNGGNDGLSSIIPKDQQDNLAAVRSNIYIPESSFIHVTDTIAFHPTMTGIKSLYDNGRLKIIQGVGYPNQNRSHFRSIDIWNTGAAADELLTTGWIGRYLDTQFPDFPANYPTEENPDPFAITIGSAVSETCQGAAGMFSMAIVDPQNLNQLSSPVNNELIEGCGAGRLSFLKTAIEQTNEYSEVIKLADENGNNLSNKYSDDNLLAQSLKTVARLISGGLKTKIYVVGLGGFDTHGAQVEEGDPITGIHANLLQTLSDAICAFQEDLGLLGLAERVLGMTYSEFGRKIRSNFSLGTDHGTAAPLLLFGACVNAGIVGDNPVISPDVGPEEGVPMQYDFRSVYGSVLMDWFGVNEEGVQDLFSNEFQYLQVADVCNDITSTRGLPLGSPDLEVYPNPFTDQLSVAFESANEWIKLSLFNSLGYEVKIFVNKRIPAGRHQLNFNVQSLPSGPYFIRMQTKFSQKTKRLIKQ